MPKSKVTPAADISPVGADLLWSLPAIATYIDRSPRATRYLIEAGRLPVRRTGGGLVALKTEVDAALRKIAGIEG